VSASFWCWAPVLALNPYSHDFFDRVDRLQDAPDRPPATVIVEFVRGLLKRYPDLSDTQTEGPWADGPLVRDANGQFIDISIVWSEYPMVVPFVVSTARHFKLDCFDPQTYQFYPGKNSTVETLPHSVTPVTSVDAAIKRRATSVRSIILPTFRVSGSPF